MKKVFFILVLYFFVTNVKAQSGNSNLTMPNTLVLPDGSVIATRSLDSVKKVMGWDDVTFSISDGIAHVHPLKNKQEQLETENKLNAQINKAAPDFEVKDLNGKLYSLASLKGKIIVLNFWFTQCGACIMEMPALNELKHSYSNKDVVFLAITFDDTAKIKTFLAKKKFDYTIIPNAENVCVDYHLYAYPTSVVIDRNGIVKFIDGSSAINNNIKSQLNKAIDEIGPVKQQVK